jgi:FdhE protein
MAAEVLAGKGGSMQVWAEGRDLEAELFATVLRLTLLPVLGRISEALAPLRRGIPWEHGHCPTCGSWPLLGEFRGLEQACFLRCGWCASEWEFSRLQCPFCGTRDHRLLGYLHVEGEEARCRAAVCEACCRRVRMVSTLAALDGPRLLVADLATLHLDLIAAERGFDV